MTRAPPAGSTSPKTGYADFGITTHQDLLLYDGEYVRYLEDAGANVHYENDGGTLDLYAVRDESGALTGFREATRGRIRRQYEAVHGLVNAQMALRPQTRGLCADMRKRQAPPRGSGTCSSHFRDAPASLSPDT